MIDLWAQCYQMDLFKKASFLRDKVAPNLMETQNKKQDFLKGHRVLFLVEGVGCVDA